MCLRVCMHVCDCACLHGTCVVFVCVPGHVCMVNLTVCVGARMFVIVVLCFYVFIAMFV